jgi:2-oxoglutarate ferredoxin oxidoreductase subunit alpha
MLLSDGAIGQMMEKVALPAPKPYKPDKPWATTGKSQERERNIITSLHLQSEVMEEVNRVLQAKYKKIKENEVRYEEYMMDDAEVILTAFGLTSRVCKKATDLARDEGIKAGLFRPITLWPFPEKEIAAVAAQERVRFFLSVEMNAGQMVEDVKLAVCGKKPVYFYGRQGGIVPTPDEILGVLKEHLKQHKG